MILAAVTLLLIIFSRKIKAIMTRGYRNNNPGNIRLTFDNVGNKILLYKGEISGTDKSFRKFKSMAYGYRALFSLLTHYVNTNGRDTIRKIINTYAPPVENQTNVYINVIETMTGVDADAPIDITDSDFFKKLVASISYMENGITADMKQINDGFDLLYS